MAEKRSFLVRVLLSFLGLTGFGDLHVLFVVMKMLYSDLFCLEETKELDQRC